MTNREYMIAQLEDPNYFDDGGASYEAMVHYNINCPYTWGDNRAVCYKDMSKIGRRNCVMCKEAWLDQEVDE